MKNKREYIFSFINEWSQLTWKGYNWITFHFITLEIENDMKMTNGWDMHFILLGLGFYFRVNFDFEDSGTGQRLKEYKEKK